ncbi:related to heterokaryon incompatibility protein het-6 [Phialocephala subalpina]|uniref:Related to heterokaryon incompatibility protein het-6 n=1 Tax=Phialocephala subalpina TaxID=576137 RepID=A0A1L7XF73_9HELO|nr:related to heterokaryon incompatibility protein het-6 [Phialocephala subalpina]
MRYQDVHQWRMRRFIGKFVATKLSQTLKPTSFHNFFSAHRISIRTQTESMGKAYRQHSMEKKPLGYRDYHYTPLDGNRHSIRLLRLLPAPDNSWPIRCKLFHTTLENAPPYIALSYTWGDRSTSQPILVDSDNIFITANLKHALARLRPTGDEKEVVFWIDSICIDQENIPERNFQTANMRAIYQHATNVAVWIGLENNNSGGALQLARDLNACTSREEITALVSDPFKKPDLEAMVILFRRQYWWRIWVIQEVSSARQATVHVGKDAISWQELDRVCNILKEAETELHSLFYKHPSYIRTLTHGGPRGLQLSRFSPHLSAPPLFELLLSHKSKKSTDPKDKVYALVGISGSQHDFGEIDYSLSEREIFTHTAHHIITASQKLDVICVKQHERGQYNLPSWVPDWTRPPATYALVVGLHHHEPEFKAAGDTFADAQFSSDGYVLRSKGIVLDTIDAVGMPYKKRGAPSDVVPALEIFHDWWNLFVATHSNSLSSQAVFARTISCGIWEFDDENIYASKLEAIFALSDERLSGSDMLRLDPPSRSSTMGSSVGSLMEVEELFNEEDGEKIQLSTILSAGLTMNRRRIFLSKEGLVGLAPFNAMGGDVICVLLGCRFPVILRPTNGHYMLVGEAYVDGFMNGEAMVGLQGGGYVLDSFEIH